MNNLRYREDLYAEELLKGGFLTQYKGHEMRILVKYYKSVGIKPIKRKELLYEFCEKHIEDFNKVLYFRMINSALSAGQKKHNNLIVIKEIPISKFEFDHVKDLELDYIHKKVVFTLLVQNKINKIVCDLIFGKHSEYNFFGGQKKHFKEVFSQSKIPSHSKVEKANIKNDINKIINQLASIGIIKLGNLGRVILAFINGIEKTDEIAFNITTFDDIGYYFDYHNNENGVIKCECCNRLVKMTGKNHRMCRCCWKEREKELWRDNKRKIRNSDNVQVFK